MADMEDQGRGAYLAPVVGTNGDGAPSSSVTEGALGLEEELMARTGQDGYNQQRDGGGVQVSISGTASALVDLGATNSEQVAEEVSTTQEHWGTYVEHYQGGGTTPADGGSTDLIAIESDNVGHSGDGATPSLHPRCRRKGNIAQLRRESLPISDLHTAEARAVRSRPIWEAEEAAGTGAIIVSPGKPPVQRRKGGRPVGSKNKKKRGGGGRATGNGQVREGSNGAQDRDEDDFADGAVPVGRGRGRSFRPEEALYIAKAWVRQSSLGCNQREENLWGGIHDICVKKYGMDRTKDAIRCKWNVLARECQHWISARALVATKLPSGRTLEEAGDQIMKLYCKKAGRKDGSGNFKSAAPFTFQETASFLAQQPKWMDNMEATKVAGESVVNGQGEVEQVAVTVGTPAGSDQFGGGSDDCDSPSEMGSGSGCTGSTRGRGLKWKKGQVKRKAEEGKVSNKLDGLMGEMAKVRKVVSEFGQSQIAQSGREEEMMMLQFLPKESSHRQVILDRMVTRLQSRIGSEGDGNGAVQSVENGQQSEDAE